MNSGQRRRRRYWRCAECGCTRVTAIFEGYSIGVIEPEKADIEMGAEITHEIHGHHDPSSVQCSQCLGHDLEHALLTEDEFNDAMEASFA